MSPSASAPRSPTSSPASARRKTRCKASPRRSARSTRSLASLASASSQAFSAERLQPYRDALSATQALEQAIAADRERAAAALRAGDDAAYADAVRAAQLATSEEMRLLADGLRQKLALYAEKRASTRSRKPRSVALSRQAIDEEYAAELAALQRRAALGRTSLADQQRVDNHDDRGDAPARR